MSNKTLELSKFMEEMEMTVMSSESMVLLGGETPVSPSNDRCDYHNGNCPCTILNQTCIAGPVKPVEPLDPVA